jgi:hypothetical protein
VPNRSTVRSYAIEALLPPPLGGDATSSPDCLVGEPSEEARELGVGPVWPCRSMLCQVAPPPVRCCPVLGRSSPIVNPKAEVMTALGDNVHIFARPHRRQDLIWCFDTVLGCGPVATVQHPAMTEPSCWCAFPVADT